MTTVEIDTMASLTAASLGSKHYEFTDLAGRIAISNLQKQVPYHLDRYLEMVGDHLATETTDVMVKYKQDIEDMVQPDRDFLISFFGCKTLQKAYLLKDSK